MSLQSFIDRKSRFSDILLDKYFHLYDVSIQQPTVLSLVYGFQSITPPEKTVKTRTIKEGTFEYPHHVFESAEVNEITMTRGTRFLDSDFDDWISGFIRGDANKRRNLMLVQYSSINASAVLGSVFGSSVAGAFNTVTSAVKPLGDLVQRIPARSWLLHQCIPTHYKASDDFNAESGGISIGSLTIQPRFWEEFSSGI